MEIPFVFGLGGGVFSAFSGGDLLSFLATSLRFFKVFSSGKSFSIKSNR